MGNCLKINSQDDISLLRGSESINTQDFAADQSGPLPIYSELLQPVFFPSPSVRRPATHLTEEEQVKLAKRIGLIQHLPIGAYDGSKKTRECVICMADFCVEEAVRYLPCMHIYHVHCIDDWLMRSLTCPSCMEPVDAALLTSYETT
ncbi:PREDICTED: RING finger protein 11 [Rhagoletis zephyria]|uniref:RING finger protein 11 n=1 Tax=Rhagoletis zephyria TaxID=28612 RepID=UPI0008118DBB|nr:PREDICTED: RING finger protein 11 [Rhagoletis zephyria]XP_017483256.1 PREDICTED: RING finger protein 11 [Rhagoletis zephyria]XP_017483316.1 PREDICTED: RING finger protein 11 [Rhagoletis zephyria]XP_036335061.1 RING finger protein 11 [Rhagoletis pomonella]XP_036335062.1 RING finger protein 11 [Rhagoletis pomonella]